MSALAINTYSGYTCLDSQRRTAPIKQNLLLKDNYEFWCKFFEAFSKNSYLSFYDEFESINDTNSNKISVAYTNEELQPIILDHNGIYALGVIKELNSLMEQQIEIDDVLIFLFDKLEDYLIEQKYDICNWFFRIINIENYNDIILIGILTATFPWKNRLSGRQVFYQYVKEKIDNIYPEEEAMQLLCGLE